MPGDFSRLANLALYDDFNTKYVYFRSLDGTVYPDKNEDYTKKRIEIANDVIMQNNVLRQKNKNSAFATSYDAKFSACLDIVHRGIDYETKNEIAYFKQQLSNFERTFTENDRAANPELAKIYNLLKEGIQDKKIINYDAFLALINGLLAGFKNAHAIASYEKKHIKDVQDALNDIRNKRVSQLHGLAIKKEMSFDEETQMIERSLSRLNKQMKVYYIENKTYASKRNEKGQIYDSVRGATTAFKKVHGAVDNEITKWIKKQLDNIFNDKTIMSKITERITKLGTYSQANYEIAANQIKGDIARAVIQHAQEHIPDILNRHYRAIPKKQLTNILEKSINIVQSYKIEGFYNNWALTGKHLKAFQEMGEDFDLHTASAAEFMEMFSRLRNAKTGKNKQLSKERSQLYDFLHGKGIYQEFSELTVVLKNLKQLEKKITAIENRIKKNKKLIGTTFEKIIGKNEEGENVILTLNITPQGVQIQENLRSTLSSLRPIQKIFGANNNISFSTLKNSIANITRQASTTLRDRIADSIDEAIIKSEEQDTQTLKTKLNLMVRDGLQNLHVSVRGPDVSELAAALNFEVRDKNKIVVNLSGRTKIKNDVIVVSMNYENFHFTTQLEGLLSEKDKNITQLAREGASQEKMAEILQVKTISTFQQDVAKEFEKYSALSKERYSTNMKVFLGRYERFSKANTLDEDAISKSYDELQKEWDTYEKILTERGENPEYIKKKYQDFLTSIERSFYISTTVKSYDYYDDAIGFGGGSIGGNLTSQLNNIADIFNLAGIPMTKDELEWLYFLIINTGDQVLLKNRYQNRIEQYLGSLAAFMLFDEGGAEIKILKDLEKKAQLSYSSPKILHLYKVNGIYVTGSYVLHKVEEELLAYRDILDKFVFQSSNNGVGIRIINRMNENMIENRGKNATPNPKINPWQDISNKADSHVSLEIFFLAGLLDIADKLESKLANIELPQ